MEKTEQGCLYLCATPIGNLGDITVRVLETLRAADAVWAEDTRRTLQLLNHFEIRKPLFSCHEHNERECAAQLVQQLQNGAQIVYVSDAGMPGISDPGAVLVQTCIRENLPFEVLPGASAVLMSAVLSGMDCHSFTFFGFLPREKRPRRETLTQLKACPHLMLVYESPLRLPATLRELAEELGAQRQAAVMRELTKIHEEAVRGTLASLCEHFREPPKGECVIAIEGGVGETEPTVQPDLDQVLLQLLSQELSTKDAAAQAAQLCGVPKKHAYRRALALSSEEEK